MKRFARSCLSLSLCASLASPLAFIPQIAEASPFRVSTTKVSPSGQFVGQLVGEGSGVLGLEGENADKAAALTDALRKQLATRGQTQAQDMTLAELKLTMGCEDGDLACIANGGETLGLAELIYGSLSGTSGEFTLTLTVLDVPKSKVVNGLTTTLSEAELSGANLDATAADLVVRLMGPAAKGGSTPAGIDDPAGDPVDDPTGGGVEGPDPDAGGGKAEKKKKDGKIVWGLQKPPKKWKLIGLGVSGGLTLASIGTAVGTTLVIQNPNGSVYKDLVAEAEKSLVDENDRNNISPDSDGDLCTLARAEPSDQPGKVTNAAMTKVCNKADALATTATASWIAAGVFGASTIVFTVLLFASKKESEAMTKMRKHDLRLGLSPRRDGGLGFSGGFRF